MSLPISHDSPEQSFSHRSQTHSKSVVLNRGWVILPAGGFWQYLETFFWLSQEEGECYRHSISRDQRGRQTSRNAQDSPTAIIHPKMPVLQRLRNPVTGDQTTQHSDSLWNLELRLRNEFTIDHPLIRANIF